MTFAEKLKSCLSPDRRVCSRNSRQKDLAEQDTRSQNGKPVQLCTGNNIQLSGIKSELVTDIFEEGYYGTA